jgi:putative membrane protein
MEAVLESFMTGLPVLLLHYLVTLTMLTIGVTVYLWMTPYKELELIRAGFVTLVIVLIVYRVIDFLMKDLPRRIELGELGPAILLAAVKLGVSIITAAAVSG